MHVKAPQPIWAYLGRTHRSRSARPPPHAERKGPRAHLILTTPTCFVACGVPGCVTPRESETTDHRRDRRKEGREVKLTTGRPLAPARAGAAAARAHQIGHADAVQCRQRGGGVGVGAAIFPGVVSLRWLARKF